MTTTTIVSTLLSAASPEGLTAAQLAALDRVAALDLEVHPDALRASAYEAEEICPALAGLGAWVAGAR